MKLRPRIKLVDFMLIVAIAAIGISFVRSRIDVIDTERRMFCRPGIYVDLDLFLFRVDYWNVRGLGRNVEVSTVTWTRRWRLN